MHEISLKVCDKHTEQNEKHNSPYYEICGSGNCRVVCPSSHVDSVEIIRILISAKEIQKRYISYMH